MASSRQVAGTPLNNSAYALTGIFTMDSCGLIEIAGLDNDGRSYIMLVLFAKAVVGLNVNCNK